MFCSQSGPGYLRSHRPSGRANNRGSTVWLSVIARAPATQSDTGDRWPRGPRSAVRDAGWLRLRTHPSGGRSYRPALGATAHNPVGDEGGIRRLRELRMLCHALSCRPARGGQLHRPEDPQADPRQADVTRRATASVGHRTTGLRGTRSCRCNEPDESFRALTRRARACASATKEGQAQPMTVLSPRSRQTSECGPVDDR